MCMQCYITSCRQIENKCVKERPLDFYTALKAILFEAKLPPAVTLNQYPFLGTHLPYAEPRKWHKKSHWLREAVPQ